MCENEKLHQAISLALASGYNIDKEAFEHLVLISKTEDPIRLVEALIKLLESQKSKQLLIDKHIIEEYSKERFLESEPFETLVIKESSELIRTSKKQTSIPAKDIEEDLKIIEDPSNKICSTGSIEDFLELFRDRFKRVEKLLRKRMDSKNAVSIKDAFRAGTKSKLKIICMIKSKRQSSKGIFLEVEDLNSAITVLVPNNAIIKVLEKANSLLPDQVVCINLKKSHRNFFIVEDINLPDIPQRKLKSIGYPLNIALISDLHIGSKQFMHKEFERFLLWLNGKYGNRQLVDAANLVKYVIIAGDIIDGVGVYPDQLQELEINDVYKQYKLAGKYFEQIPDYIKVIVIPGNHDTSRKALPQPAIQKEFKNLLCESRPVLSLGNPATICIHGLNFLIYHGRSLDDVFGTASNMDFHSPERAMKLLLQSRHLAPSYGQRTSIAPETRDFLVIEQVPDIFHAGHVHVMKHCYHRGTLIVNSGAWQTQTSYQRNLGLKPTPGIIPIVNIQTLKIQSIDFNKHYD